MSQKPSYEELERKVTDSEKQRVEHERTEEVLQRTELWLERIFNSLEESVLVITPNRELVKVNNAAERMFGYSRDELKNLSTEVLHVDQKHYLEFGRLIKEAFDKGEAANFEFEAKRKNGEIFQTEHTVSLLKNGDGDTLGIVSVVRDITERKTAEEVLRHSEQRYRQITEAVTDYIFTVRVEDGRPVETSHNAACVAVTGYTSEEFASDPNLWIRMVHEEDLQLVEKQAARILAGQEIHSIEHRIVRKDGGTVWVRSTLVPHHDPQGKLLSYDGLIRDISEQNRLQSQLQKSQKMEAIGTLAGGIAHDFNNILAAIMGYTELVIEDVPQGSTAKSNLEEIFKAGIRAKDLVGQILAFSRHSEHEQTPLQPTSIIKEALKLLRASLPTTIEIRQNIGGQSNTILADPTQIHQVLMNLCTNGAHAIQDKGEPGVLEVTLDDVDLDADAAARHPDLKPGHYVRLAVSDTGCGMDRTVLERAFDPFFTTKAVGKGTGMGLSVVHGIVKDHGGAILTDSKPGKGTTFQVFFPKIETEEGQHEAVGPLPTGNERILFVDDEKALAAVGKKSLERLGYEVVAKTSSIEALEAFRAQPDKFDLVITDLTMPNMTGTELQKELVAIRQDIPVILCTGFGQMVSGENAKAMGIRQLVVKPFLKSEIAKTIRRVLDNPSGLS